LRAVCCWARCWRRPPDHSTLVDHVNGITLNARGEVERFTGLVIDRDGRVSALLHAGDPRPAHPDYELDGKGAVLLPGLIDAHAMWCSPALPR
jgi:imidazolonepropionase-like amidohydrolase